MAVVLVYSTGRCGTQFLRKFFEQNLGTDAVVRHEPIGPEYAPKRALRHENLGALRRKMPIVDRHLDDVADIVSGGRIYIETGWPAFAWCPLFKKIFGNSFRYIHVIRNPFYFAGSLLTHNFYQPEKRNDRYIQLAQLDPCDRGVLHKEFSSDWPNMSPYERCLFQWLEINRYAEELATQRNLAPTASVRFEDVFSGASESLKTVFQAAQVGDPISLDVQYVDRHRRSTNEVMGIHSTQLDRAVRSLASVFGYTEQDLRHEGRIGSLARRYSEPSRDGSLAKDPRVKDIVRRIANAVIGRYQES